MNNKSYILLIFFFIINGIKAQIVNISQPQTTAQLLSPASVGEGQFQQRVQSNLRTQIIGGSNLYNTAVVGWDRKVKNLDPEKSNFLGIGIQVVSDRLMNGIVQNNAISLNFAYHMFLDKNLYNNISLGMGGMFSQTSIDKTNLTFGDQFYNSGVSTGAGSMEALKKYPSSLSMNSGLLFTRHDESMFFKIGISGFYFVKPQVTFSELNQSSGLRKLVVMNLEHHIFYNNTFLIHAYASEQNGIRKYFGGFAFSFPISNDWEQIKRLYVGCSYRRGESYIPTVSFLMDKYTLGFSYDLNNVVLTGSQIKQTNFEISYSRSFGYRKADLFRTLFD